MCFYILTLRYFIKILGLFIVCPVPDVGQPTVQVVPVFQIELRSWSAYQPRQLVKTVALSYTYNTSDQPHIYTDRHSRGPSQIQCKTITMGLVLPITGPKWDNTIIVQMGWKSHRASTTHHIRRWVTEQLCTFGLGFRTLTTYPWHPQAEPPTKGPA
jgi:hypothetical protein